MSQAKFALQLKSTLDYLMNKLKDDLVAGADPYYADLAATELDNLVQIDQVIKSTNPALIWQFGNLVENPRDPLYSFSFSVGAKTTQDDANYVLAGLVAEVSNLFSANKDFQIYDYSGTLAPDPADKKGFMLISGSATTEQMYDNQSGLRMWNVNSKVVRMTCP